MSLRIVLVRHGLSSFNVEQRIQGRDDLSALTEEGVEQARAAGAALASVPFDAAYSSPMQRARDTARHLLDVHPGELSPGLEDDLLEIDLAPWSGLLRRELRDRYPGEEATWRTAPHTLELERRDGSRYRPLPELMEQAARFRALLLQRHRAALAGEDQSVLVVAHNAILRCLVLTLLGLDATGFRRLRLDNGSLSVLNLSSGVGGAPSVQLESLNGTAHLGEPLPARGTGPRLLLVRHGETDWNRQGRFQGQIDIPLNANGLAQAEAAGTFLASVSIHRAYTSALARPRQTAEQILACHPGVPLTATRGLVEIGHGLWEGRLEREINEGWPQLLAAWKRAPQTVQMPEGETIHDVWHRSLDTWRTIAASLEGGETALVVAHDAVNKAILCGLLGLTPADIWMIKQGNGGVSVIDYPPAADGTAVLAALNLTSHLGGVLDSTAAGAL
ncbi:MAG: histidine phosphatase family protein [Cyanobacteria bacterium J06638_7]